VDKDQLFPTESRLPNGGRQGSSRRAGCVAELLATAELLQRGHKVAVPVVDDDGIDLVVDYRWRVQVKSSTQRTRDNCIRFTLSSRGRTNATALYSKVDIWLLFSWSDRAFYVVPADEIRGRTNVDMTRKYLAWFEAWHVFSDLAAVA
jgi:hypothetical protein